MNHRIRMKLRALLMRKYPPVMCMVPADFPPGHMVVFIDPRELDAAKAKYGDDLKVIL